MRWTREERARMERILRDAVRRDGRKVDRAFLAWEKDPEGGDILTYEDEDRAFVCDSPYSVRAIEK